MRIVAKQFKEVKPGDLVVRFRTPYQPTDEYSRWEICGIVTDEPYCMDEANADGSQWCVLLAPMTGHDPSEFFTRNYYWHDEMVYVLIEDTTP